MEFKGLKPEYQILKKNIISHLDALMASSSFIMGEEVKSLEKKLATYVGVKYCLSCASGTDALLLALWAMDVQPGDLIISPAFSYIATASCIKRFGATPVFVDVDEQTYNISIQSLKDAIYALKVKGRKCKGIITADLFGLPTDYSQIMQIARDNQMFVIEDCAQSFGAKINDRRACSFGDIAITSFFPAKPYGCYGDGGAIFTNRVDLADKIWSLKNHGRTRENKYENVQIGINSRLDTMQAAVLLEKFDFYINCEIERLGKIADFYNQQLQNYVKVPIIEKDYLSVWAQYTIELRNEQDRNELKDYLYKYGIPSMIYYPIPLHKQIALEDALCLVPLVNAEHFSKTVLSLPIHPFLSNEDQEKVVNTVISYFEERKYGKN